MGMFDWVSCEMPLPDGLTMKDFPHGLQTKSFDRMLTKFKVTKDGDLMQFKWDVEPTGRWYIYDFNKPFDSPGYTVWVDPPEDPVVSDWFIGDGPWPENVRTNERWEKRDYTGEFNFYATKNEEWHEYIATVENGEVVSIRVSKECNLAHK